MAKVCTDLNGVCMKEQEIQDKALKAYPYDIRGQYSHDANDGKRQGYVTGYKEALQQVMKDSVAKDIGLSEEDYNKAIDKCLYGKEPELVDDGDLPKEEPVSNDFEMALAEMIDKAQTSVVEPLVVAAQWKDELIKLAKSEELVSEEWIEELRTKLDSMSKEEFKQVWKKYEADYEAKEKEVPVSDDLETFAEEWRGNNCPNAPSVIDAIKAGALWQKQKDMQKFLHSETATFTREEFDAEMENVRKQTKEQMIDKACEYLMDYEFNDCKSIKERRTRVELFRKAMEDYL